MLNGLLLMFAASMVSLGIITLLVIVNAGITIALAAVIGGGYALLMKISRNRLRRLGPIIINDQAKLIQTLQEAIGGIRDIILNGSQQLYIEAYNVADHRLRENRGFGQFISLAPRY